MTGRIPSAWRGSGHSWRRTPRSEFWARRCDASGRPADCGGDQCRTRTCGRRYCLRHRLHTKFANLNEPLLDYRVHAGQVTTVATDTMARNGARVRLRWLQQLGLEPTEEEMKRHEAVAWLRTGSAEELRLAGIWLQQIGSANDRSGLIASPALAALLDRRWFEFCNAHSRLGWRARKIHRLGLIGNHGAVTWLRRLRFMLLCAVRQHMMGGRHD